jgi:hypothetical protein
MFSRCLLPPSSVYVCIKTTWYHIPEDNNLDDWLLKQFLVIVTLSAFLAGKILSATVVPGEGKHTPCCDDGNQESIS